MSEQSHRWGNILSRASATAPKLRPVEGNVTPLRTIEDIAKRVRELDGELIAIQGEEERLVERYGRAMAERTGLQEQLLAWAKEHLGGWRVQAEPPAELARSAKVEASDA